jgi:hypothetical protein
MFWSVARYELKYRMTRISTHVYALVFFALALLLGLSAAGAFEGVDMSAGARVLANSPYMIGGLVTTLGLFGVVVTASFMGQALVKDFEHTVHPLLFTTPLSKGAYLGGRYVGALVAALYVMAAVLPGLALAYALPFVDADLVGPTRALAYLQPYLLFVLPNTVVTGALFFGLAALTRQMLPNYVGGVLLLMGYLVAALLTTDVENLRTAAIVDPFGNYAYEVVTRYWTTAEKNTLLLPLEGVLALNRILWLGVGAAALVLTFARFRLAQGVGGRRRKGEVATAAPSAERRPISALALPDADRQFGAGARLGQTLSLARREWGAIVRNVYFYVLLLAALGFFAIGAIVGGAVFGTPTLPVTAEVLNLVTGGFVLFVLVIIVFYAGELVWRERDLKSAQIYDALPVPSWLPFAAKTLALWGALATVLAVMMVVGIVYQLIRGFTDVEVTLYLAELFGVQFVDFALVAVMALTIHTVVNHKYVGHFVLILYLIGLPILMGIFGYDHNLYDFGSDPGTPYSDMNGYGHFLGPFVWFKLYWAAFAVLLAVASALVWQRGPEGGVRRRLKSARLRLSRPVLATTAIALVAFIALGGFIFYNTNVLNEYRTEEEQRDLLAEYERKYKQFEGVPQPRITAVETQVDLFPYEREARLRGTYTLVNKTDAAIPAVHLDLPSSLVVRQLAFGRPAEATLVDSTLGFRTYALAQPLAPGDSTTLAFDLGVETEGFGNSRGPTSIVYNGTFLNNGVFPSIGYQPSGELADPSAREDVGLPPRPRAASIDDSTAARNTDLANDADFVRFAATVSTVEDQIAIAPGRLQREWVEDGRRFFRYEMGSPILNFYSFLSARYAVAEDTWRAPDGRTIDIQVFYHPAHDYNVERMIAATQSTLDYATEAFSPYQYDQVRIVEFPRYAQFAQSFPNTIPFSESIGFIADVGDGDDDIDYPTYVTAHEVAHQWWGHQVAGGAVQGSAVIVETLAQYTALMVMEEQYGEAKMGRFLGYELDQYLVGRTLDRVGEVPLYLAEGQQYIHYNKGSLAMYALQEYVGEAQVNAALSRFVDDYAFRGPPYPTTRDLLRELRAVTPDSLGYLVEDLFETITLYENRAVSATASALGDGRYRVALALDLGKVRADSIGAEQPAPMNDWLEIAAYDEDGDVLASEQRRLRAGEQTVELVVRGRPARAGVDPRNVFPDRVRADNTTAVSVE